MITKERRRRTNYKVLCLLLVLLVAVWKDISTYKIPNRLILVSWFVGISWNSIQYGFYGFLYSFLGLLVPILLLFFLFIFRMLGAGDIKLLSTVGVFYGGLFAIEVVYYSLLFASVQAFFLVFRRKNIKDRIVYFLKFFRKESSKVRMRNYSQGSEASDKNYYMIHFSVSILLAFLLGYFRYLK